MKILDEIIQQKRLEIAERKSETPYSRLEESPFFKERPRSLRAALTRSGSSGIIAEFKRQSPSAGTIHPHADPVEITRGYVEAGAAALSVLTDRQFFGGSRSDLMAAREVNQCPILRKDFIIDEYQVMEARALGADAILLIAAILDNSDIQELAILAHQLGMEVLLEVHRVKELSSLHSRIDLVGVNNRNLKKMKTDPGKSIKLAEKIPGEMIRVSESGISRPETIGLLRKLGYSGFLIGESFMKTKDPAAACRKLIGQLSRQA